MRIKIKKYKQGDRIFFECFDGSIGSDIVLKVEEREGAIDMTDKVRKYQMLYTDENTCIENYNCLKPSDPKCKDIAKQYKAFDKKKKPIAEAINKALEPLSNDLKKELLTKIIATL